MKYICLFLSITFFSLLALSLSSCEEVIQLDLKESERRLVIEANLDAGTGTCIVKISKSGSFYQTANFENISLASVQIVQGSRIYQLSEISPGHYQNDSISVQPNDPVQLFVKTADQQEFTAYATVPNPIVLDSMVLDTFSFPFGDTVFYISQFIANWLDSPNYENFYRFKIYLDDEYQKGEFVLVNDKNRNGDYFKEAFYGGTFDSGQKIKMELLTCNKAYYNYFNQLSEVLFSGGFTATPYNPHNNFDQDVLGYFGIWYAVSDSLVIP